MSESVNFMFDVWRVDLGKCGKVKMCVMCGLVVGKRGGTVIDFIVFQILLSVRQDAANLICEVSFVPQLIRDLHE